MPTFSSLVQFIHACAKNFWRVPCMSQWEMKGQKIIKLTYLCCMIMSLGVSLNSWLTSPQSPFVSTAMMRNLSLFTFSI